MVQRPEPKDPAVVEKLNALSEEEESTIRYGTISKFSNYIKKNFT